jgi:hypothetical protein
MTYATARTALAAHSRCAHDPKPASAFLSRTLAYAALLFAMPLAAAPLPVPEILHYTFDESGTTVTNHASAPPAGTQTGTILGTTYSQGVPFTPIAHALSASGAVSSSTDFLDTNWATDFGTGSWTISFFTSEVPPSTTLFYVFGDESANLFRCFTNGVAGPGNYMLRGDGLYDVLVTGAADGGSHMVTFVYDQPSNQILAYKDAVRVDTVPQPGPVSIVGVGPYKVGGYSDRIGLNGKMADYRIYSRALTPAEILDIYTFITMETPMTADMTAHTDAACHGGNDGSLTVTPTGGLGPYTYLWSNGGTDATASSLAAGDYTVAVTDNFGLVANASATITEPAAIVFGGPLTDGYPLVPYSGSVAASGGTGTLTHAKTAGALPPGITLQVDGTLAGTPTTLGTFNFTISATDTNTCLVEQAYTLNIVADPDLIFRNGFDGT